MNDRIIRNPGFPLPRRLNPAPPSPAIYAQRNPDPTTKIANPGEYESITLRSGGFITGPFSINYVPPIQLSWTSDKLFNCLEIDMECIATPRGWAVPDKIGVALDPTSRARAVAIPNVTSGIGQQATGTPFWYLDLDFVFNPPKQFVEPQLNDPTLSATMFGGKVLRWYGTTPFSRVGIAGWAKNDASTLTNILPAQQPFFYCRRWYDPSRRVLTTG